jgi:hypothetical protein
MTRENRNIRIAKKASLFLLKIFGNIFIILFGILSTMLLTFYLFGTPIAIAPIGLLIILAYVAIDHAKYQVDKEDSENERLLNIPGKDQES